MNAKVYTRPNCQPCKAVKRHLTRLGADWYEIPLDESNAHQFRSQGFAQAPITVVYDEAYGDLVVDMFSGYHPDKIDEHFRN